MALRLEVTAKLFLEAAGWEQVTSTGWQCFRRRFL